jgi:hypothetical protein
MPYIIYGVYGLYEGPCPIWHSLMDECELSVHSHNLWEPLCTDVLKGSSCVQETALDLTPPAALATEVHSPIFSLYLQILIFAFVIACIS